MMTLARIQVEVDEKTAQFYGKAGKEEREKIRLLLGLWMFEFEGSDLSLTDLMDDISDKAQSRGLTPEILETLQ